MKGHRPELRVLYRREVVPGPKAWKEFASDFEMQPALRMALDMGVAQTIAHLERAFC